MQPVFLGPELRRKDSDRRNEMIEQWTAFSKELLKLGADPLALTQPDSFTPLELLSRYKRHDFGAMDWEDTHHSVEGVRLWAEILLEAGIDLASYAVKQFEAWNYLQRKMPLWRSKNCIAIRPIFNRAPTA